MRSTGKDSRSWLLRSIPRSKVRLQGARKQENLPVWLVQGQESNQAGAVAEPAGLEDACRKCSQAAEAIGLEVLMPPAGVTAGTFGSELAAALTGLRPSPVARAAGLLHHVLLGNAACKRGVLQGSSAGGREGPLLVRCCRQLANMLASGQQGASYIPLPLPDASTVARSMRVVRLWVDVHVGRCMESIHP